MQAFAIIPSQRKQEIATRKFTKTKKSYWTFTISFAINKNGGNDAEVVDLPGLHHTTDQNLNLCTTSLSMRTPASDGCCSLH